MRLGHERQVGEYMFCSNCGRKINERDTVCPYCGSPVEEEFCNGFCRISEQKGEEDAPSAMKKHQAYDQHVQRGDSKRGTGGVSERKGSGSKGKEQIPVQILLGIIGLLLFLLIIQSIRLGIAGHEEVELRKKNIELEKAQVELMHKYEELQQSLSQSEPHEGPEQEETGQSDSHYDYDKENEEVSDYEDNSETGHADAQSSTDDDLQHNVETNEESSPDSAHQDNGQDDDIYTGGVYEE